MALHIHSAKVVDTETENRINNLIKAMSSEAYELLSSWEA